MRRNPTRLRRLPLVLLAVTGLAAVVVASASAGSGAAKGIPDAVIKMKRDGGRLFFAPERTPVDSGDLLELVNKTNPNQVGPHTFSLVKKRALPETRRQLNHCFDPGHICARIARWHKVDQNGNPTVDPVDVGMPGWDRMGNRRKKGDSKVFDDGKGETFEQIVSAQPDTKLFFMCAVHPEMQGKIRVRPNL
jgi:plastocyanin